MKCPICKKPVPFGVPFMPFCSERCKLIDLGDWASEKYVISSPTNVQGFSPSAANDEEAL